jgi:hypothetical protein
MKEFELGIITKKVEVEQITVDGEYLCRCDRRQPVNSYPSGGVTALAVASDVILRCALDKRAAGCKDEKGISCQPKVATP